MVIDILMLILAAMIGVIIGREIGRSNRGTHFGTLFVDKDGQVYLGRVHEELTVDELLNSPSLFLDVKEINSLERMPEKDARK